MSSSASIDPTPEDSEAHARRAQLLEEQLQLRDEKVAELQAKAGSSRFTQAFPKRGEIGVKQHGTQI